MPLPKALGRQGAFSRIFGRFFVAASHCLSEPSAATTFVCCGTESMTEPSLPEEPIFAQALEIGSPTERAAAVRRFECLRSPFAWVPGGRSLRRPQPPARIGRTSMLFGTGLK